MLILKSIATLVLALVALVSGSSRKLVQLAKNAPIQAETPPGEDKGGTAGGC